MTSPGLEHPPGWELFDSEVADPVADLGPLRGVLTALEHSSTELTIVITVDMPCIGSDQLNWLGEQMVARPQTLGLMCSRAIGDIEQVEPFPSIYHKGAAEVIAHRLADGKYSVHSLLQSSGFIQVPAPATWPESTWTNLNRPEDYQRFIAGLLPSNRQ